MTQDTLKGKGIFAQSIATTVSGNGSGISFSNSNQLYNRLSAVIRIESYLPDRLYTDWTGFSGMFPGNRLRAEEVIVLVSGSQVS